MAASAFQRDFVQPNFVQTADIFIQQDYVQANAFQTFAPTTVTAQPLSVTTSIVGTPYPYLYIVDSLNHRVVVTDYHGNPKFTFGSYGTGNGQFNRPYWVATDGRHLYVTDSGNARVQKFTMKGVYVSQWGSTGTDYGQFNNPMGIAVDRNFVWVIDSGNHRFQVFDKNGTFIFTFGEFGSGEHQFNTPTDCSIDDVYFYIHDTGNNRIVTYLKPTEFPALGVNIGRIRMSATAAILSLSANLDIGTIGISADATVDKSLIASCHIGDISMSGTAVVDMSASSSINIGTIRIRSIALVDKATTGFINIGAVKMLATALIDKAAVSDINIGTIQMMAFADIIPISYVYSGICVNTKTGAHTEYDNYVFNSFCFFKGKYYGANDNGLFLLEGIDDSGAFIDAYFKSGDIDTWRGSESMPPVTKAEFELWLSHQTSGEMEMEVTGDEDGTYTYPIQENGRVKIGRGFKSRFFSFKGKNKRGSSFTVENMRLKATGTRRIR